MTTPYRRIPHMDPVDYVLQAMLGFDEGTLEWQRNGACHGVFNDTDDNPFFSPSGDDDNPKSEPDRDKRIAKARSICAGCPVQVECVVWALRTEDRHAIAGGKTPTERRPFLSQWLHAKEDLWGEPATEFLTRLAKSLLGR